MEEQQKNQLMVQQDYIKSNILIASKYKSSLLENKILAFAFANISNMADDKENGGYRFSFSASELMKIMGAKPGSIYQRLDHVAKEMTGRTIGISDPETKRFRYDAVVQSAEYGDGIFTIWFNKRLKNFYMDISANFTKLNLEVMLSFDSVYSFRLYEILKSQCYHRKGDNSGGNHYEIPFDLAELKLDLGIVNAELDSVKRVLNDSEYPDYQAAVDKSPEKLYEDWSAFRRAVIDVAVKEISQTTDMKVSYDTIRSGRGGKVQKIVFLVDIIGNQKDAEEENSTAKMDEDELMDYIQELCHEAGVTVKIKEARTMAQKAEYDSYRIFRAVNVYKGAKDDVKDPIAFLITAIEKEYTPSKKQFENWKNQKRAEEESYPGVMQDAEGQMEFAPDFKYNSPFSDEE